MTESFIHRVNFENQFTITHNSAPEDENLSWSAKGLLWYIISRPKDWKIHRNHLSKIYKGDHQANGADAIDRMFNELIERKYIIYTKQDPATGKMLHRYDVYPIPYPQFQKIFPKGDNPAVDSPAVGKSHYIPSNDLVPNKEQTVVYSRKSEDEKLSDNQSIQEKEETPKNNLRAATSDKPRRKTFTRPNGSQFEITVDDIHAYVVRNKLRLSMEDIAKGWDLLIKYEGVVTDAFKLFESFYKPDKPGGSSWMKTQNKISKNKFSVKDTQTLTLDQLRSENEKLKQSTAGSLKKNPFASLLEKLEQEKHIYALRPTTTS